MKNKINNITTAKNPTEKVIRVDAIVSNTPGNIAETLWSLQLLLTQYIFTTVLLFNEFRDTEPGDPGKLNRYGLGELQSKPGEPRKGLAITTVKQKHRRVRLFRARLFYFKWVIANILLSDSSSR